MLFANCITASARDFLSGDTHVTQIGSLQWTELCFAAEAVCISSFEGKWRQNSSVWGRMEGLGRLGCAHVCHVAFFYPSSRNFIGPLRLNLSKSIKFSRSGAKTKRGGGVFVKFTVHFKNFMVGEKKFVIHIYKIHTSLVRISTITSLQLFEAFFHCFSHCTKPEQEEKNWKLCLR